jgi:hypothetical protein
MKRVGIDEATVRELAYQSGIRDEEVERVVEYEGSDEGDEDE